MLDKIFSRLNLNLSSSQKRNLLILLIIILALIPTIYLAKQTQILKPKAQESNIPSLTDQLLESKKDYESKAYDRVGAQTINQDPLNKMISIATIRKNLLVKEARENPQLFLDQATLTDLRGNFPVQIQPLIEEKKDLQGKITVFHLDGLDNKQTQTVYQIRTDEKIYDLQLLNIQPTVETDSEISVKGVSLDNEIVVAAGSLQGNFISVTPGKPQPVGEQKTIVLLARFEGNTDEPVSVEEVRHMVFDSDRTSVNSYYKDNSLNNTFFTGDVFGWFTIENINFCNFGNYALSIDNAAKAAGIDFSFYNRIIYVIPESPCGSLFSGIGTIGGNPSRSYIFSPTQLSTYMHEMGHNLGIHHADSINCADSKCNQVQYGEPYEIMGGAGLSSNYYGFNGPHKVALGWIPPYKVQVASGSGVFQLNNIESSTKLTPQAIKIFKPDTEEYYIVSFRKAIGFDSSLPEVETRGVSVHIWNGNPGNPTKLIDVTPLTGGDDGFKDATLSDGESYVDDINGVEIKQLSHDSTTALVEVKNAPPIPLGTIEGTYVDISDDPLRLEAHKIKLTGSVVGYRGSSVQTPGWLFNNLYPGTYTLTASPIPGYDVYYSYCYNCTNHSSYIKGYQFETEVFPAGGFIDVRFKYVPAGTVLPHPSLPPGSD